MQFDEFLQQACPALDLQWRKYRRRAARHRIDQRLRELGLAGYEDYLALLRADPLEAAALPETMLVTVSRFFRERERWEILARQVLPRLLAGKAAGEPLRSWSAGCCGGEEPYTLAIVWREAGQPAAGLDILATDIDEESLARARRAEYQEGSLREVPDEVRRRHFRPRDGRWAVREEIRKTVRFARHHLQRDPPPEGMDLVLCRYLVFTYFDGRRRLQAAERLRQALRPGGALMIGARENLGEAERIFEPWPGAEGIFRPGA